MERRIKDPNQIRWNFVTGDLVMPRTPILWRNDKPIENSEIQSRVVDNDKPEAAYINSENLDIVKERMKFEGSDKELIDKLVVFMGKKTEIKLDPKEEAKNKYSIKLNIGIIAQEVLAIDDFDVPDGYKFYQLLGVYSEYKATGKVSTDKCTRKYATIQKSNCSHPEPFYLKENFFAKPEDAIKVKKSNIEKTGYYWNKKK